MVARRGQRNSARSAVRKAKAVVSTARAVASAARAASRADPTEVVESAPRLGQVAAQVDAFGTNLVIQAFQHKRRMCFVALNRGYSVFH